MLKPNVYAILAILIWSTLATLGQALSKVPPFLLVGLSLMIGALCGLPWVRTWRVSLKTLALGIYGLFGYHFFLFVAFQLAPPIEVNLLNYLWPLMIVLLTPVLLRGYHLSLRHVLAALLGLVGTVLIVGSGKNHSILQWSWGYVFAALSAFIWASYSLLLKRVTQLSTGVVGLFCLVSSIASFVCHFLFEQRYNLNSQEGMILILLGLGPMGLAFYLWDAAMKLGDPRQIATLSYLTPLLSTSLLIYSGEGNFTLRYLIALGLIVCGAWLGSRAKQRGPRV